VPNAVTLPRCLTRTRSSSGLQSFRSSSRSCGLFVFAGPPNAGENRTGREKESRNGQHDSGALLAMSVPAPSQEGIGRSTGDGLRHHSTHL
jgi:hypothetical protein